MIQPLRTMHRRAFVGLAFVLPVLLLAGLGARRPRVPSSVGVPQLPVSADLLRKSGTLWPKHTLRTEIYEDSNHLGNIHVVLYPAQELSEPDLLLYWSAARPSGESLPGDARLLGPFIAARPYTLPLNTDRAGYLILFSLPHQTVFDTAQVERVP
jgi:hypothetical protein